MTLTTGAIQSQARRDAQNASHRANDSRPVYRDAASALGLSTSMIKRLVLTGRIGGVRIGTARRIPVSEIERVIAEGVPA